jgi:site-specific DNA recombinase
MPTAPPAATLQQVADHIADIVRAGSDSQRKALIEVLAQIKITGRGRLVPVFRIPQQAAADQPQVPAGPAIAHSAAAEDPVRAMINLVVGGPNASRCEPRSCGRRRAAADVFGQITTP